MPIIQPPRLRNDCFALPSGVNWTPVDQAKQRLRNVLSVVVSGGHKISVSEGNDRILFSEIYAARSNPPGSNSAVDGYGFSGPVETGIQVLNLAPGRASAGAPFDGMVEKGRAVRILTGALLPEGVDTVVLEEDCTVEASRIAFNGPLNKWSNTRGAGEDILKGSPMFGVGHRLSPTDLSYIASAGVSNIEVFSRLKVGVLSTGDEVRELGSGALDWQIYDANRLMLLAMIREIGFEAVDLGLVKDERNKVRQALNAGAEKCDLLITSGGASAGDEDHISAILKSEGMLNSWRIALKPGRPLALGLWNDTPIIGLPGNPVAAWVCALVFGRPAMEVLAGGHWREPRGYKLEASFRKNKRRGRSEYLRARIMDDGRVEVFPSEGSGRISSISWSDGLVEIGFEEELIELGSKVRFIPYSEFLRPSYVDL